MNNSKPVKMTRKKPLLSEQSNDQSNDQSLSRKQAKKAQKLERLNGRNNKAFNHSLANA